MFLRPLCVFSLVVTGCLQAGCLQAQTQNQTARAPDTWPAVEQLPAGRRVEIRARQAWLRCTFIGADSDTVSCHVNGTSSLLLSVPPHDEQVPRAEVVSIRTFGIRGAVVGTVLGAGTGAVLGLVKGDNGPDRALLSISSGLLLGFLGYAIGNFVDGVREFFPHHVLYRRP